MGPQRRCLCLLPRRPLPEYPCRAPTLRSDVSCPDRFRRFLNAGVFSIGYSWFFHSFFVNAASGFRWLCPKRPPTAERHLGQSKTRATHWRISQRLSYVACKVQRTKLESTIEQNNFDTQPWGIASRERLADCPRELSSTRVLSIRGFERFLIYT